MMSIALYRKPKGEMMMSGTITPIDASSWHVFRAGHTIDEHAIYDRSSISGSIIA